LSKQVLQFRSVAHITLPRHQHIPTKLAQFFDASLIAVAVALKLWSPILGLRSWQLSSVGAVVTMPEAAVHEDHLTMARKHDVGITGQLLVVQPVAVAQRMQRTAHYHLWPRVRLADALHALSQSEFSMLRHPVH
jgi:hypothetical protein